MILGKCYHRYGRKWMVSASSDGFIAILGIISGDRFIWEAYGFGASEYGYSSFAFLARCRAIAALRKMAQSN